MIYIGLGANLPGQSGDPELTLNAAVKAIEDRGYRLIARSSIWLSAPVPYNETQPWYRNAVIAISSENSPQDVLRDMLAIEAEFGRVRTIPNAPRVLDLDILAYDEQCCEAPGLNLPHPRLHERAFVLYPLREIAPDWVHPRLGQSVKNLISTLPPGQDIRPASSNYEAIKAGAA